MKGYMEKEAIVPLMSTGGGSYLTNHGLGLEAGYSHLLGVLPIPEVGIRLGNEQGGVSVSGPIPGIGADNGLTPGRWNVNSNRSLWQYLKDKIQGKRDITFANGSTNRIEEHDYDDLVKYQTKAERATDIMDKLRAINNYNKVYEAIKKTENE
jgi:hypothetical protein